MKTSPALGSSLSHRLVLLVSIPLLALAFFGFTLIHNAYQSLEGAERTAELVETAVAAGAVVHALQSERGTSAGFILSRGEKFSDTLPGLREKSDQAISRFRQQVDGMHLEGLPGLKNDLESARRQLGELAGIREQIGRFALSPAESTAHFSKTIGLLVQGMDTLALNNPNAEIGKYSNAYQALVRAKENAGLERALTNLGFVADRVDPAQYRAILQRIERQEAYLDVFRSLVDPAEKAGLEAALNSEAAQEVVRMRGIMAEKSATGGFGVAPALWFQKSTGKIDQLYGLEQQLTQKIHDRAAALMSEQRSVLVRSSILTLLAVGLTLVAAFWIGRSVSLPLNNAVSVAEFATTNDDFSRSVPSEGVLEVARVAQAFNHLMGEFRRILGEATRSSTQISDASHQLVAACGQLNAAAGQQSDASVTIAAAIEEVSVSVSETAASAGTVSQLAQRSGQETEVAIDVMSRAVHSVDRITDLITTSSQHVVALEQSSQQIGGIIQVIKEIADQTNLLALNAAIEAARAGEQGRGFAVVADEVRKLAERSAHSTEEIASLIQNIQRQIGDAVSTMHEASEQATQNRQLVADTETALRGIGEGSQTMVVHVRTIADAIREQDAALQQVAISVEKIAQMTEESRAAANANSDTATQMQGLADSLQSAVARFRI